MSEWPLGVKEGRYDALAARLAESERVRRQLAEALAAYRSALRSGEAEGSLAAVGDAALAASDALGKEET